MLLRRLHCDPCNRYNHPQGCYDSVITVAPAGLLNLSKPLILLGFVRVRPVE